MFNGIFLLLILKDERLINIKNIIKILFVLISIGVISGCQSSSNETKSETLNPMEEQYDNYAKSFKLITTEDIATYEENDDTYLVYTGRKTCPYCRIFVPKLYEVGLKTVHNDIDINYLNSENENDLGLEAFREKHDIPYVPDLSYFQGEKLVKSMVIYDDTTTQEIDDFFLSIK